jgi:5-methyltetrahydrofolate--homocysteine methyltransferase
VTDSDEILDVIFDAVLDGKVREAAGIAQRALDQGVSADTILQDACIPAMDEVGIQFEQGEKFVPEMLISAKTMQSVVQVLRPHLLTDDASGAGTLLIGTVAGDVHDIGKNLVGMMMEGAGFQVIDLGVDVSAERFVEAVQTHKPNILGLSALLSTTMPAIGVTIRTLEQAGLRDSLKIMVGGAPVSEAFAKQVGADGYAADAGSAARVAKGLLGAV